MAQPAEGASTLGYDFGISHMCVKCAGVSNQSNRKPLWM